MLAAITFKFKGIRPGAFPQSEGISLGCPPPDPSNLRGPATEPLKIEGARPAARLGTPQI